MPAPIVFDLDGTLIDTELAWDAVRRELALAHGGRWTAGASTAMQGQSTDEWTAYMVDELGTQLTPAEVLERTTAGLLARYAEDASLWLPGAQDVVRALAADGRALAVASSSPRVLIEEVLRAGGLEAPFSVVVSSEEVPRGKPSPDVFLEAARRLGAEPASCLAVEDSTAGLRAAAAAGMVVLAVPSPHDPPPADALALATAVAEDLSALLASGAFDR